MWRKGWFGRPEPTRTAASEMGGEPERRHYLFTGRVQFVGFRYRSMYLAQEYGITGWVYNQSDGRVEMEAQGTAELLKAFKQALYELPGVLIESCEEEKEEPVKNEKAFQVRG